MNSTTAPATKTSGSRFLRNLCRALGRKKPTKQDTLSFAPLKDWIHHAEPRHFDWDWKATNYNRIALVNLLLAKKHDPAYLEIGCASNALFDSVPVRHKVGVDPAEGGTLRTTSDAFFAGNKTRFDVMFIDGLHTYEQVRNDVINALRHLNHNGWVALHDMLPRNWLEHHVPRLQGNWTGDVWKVGFELAQSEGIDFKILKIDHGVGVFRKLQENATLHDMTSELHQQQFAYFCDNLEKLPLVEWGAAYNWITAA
jgi:hypothetical protein